MALWENVIGYGLHAERPAAGSPGALYFEGDTGNGYRDSGTVWDLVVTPAGAAVARTIVPITADTTLSAANALCIIQTTDAVVTLPDPALCTGLTIAVVTDAGAFGVKQNDGTTDAPQSGISPALYISDGATWRTLYGFWA